MSDTWLALASSIGGACITGVFSFLAVYWSNQKSVALLAFRMEQLEKKVEKHNQHGDKINELERQIAKIDERLRWMAAPLDGVPVHRGGEMS